MTIAAIHHILLDDRGRAHIAGSRIRVSHLVMEMQANGWSAEDLYEQHPHLPRAAIHAALAYYYDHQAEFDQQIEAETRYVQAMREAAGPSPLAQRLRAEGRLQ